MACCKKKPFYRFKVASDLGDIENKDAKAKDIWGGFKEQTTAHGIPHVDQAKGKVINIKCSFTLKKKHENNSSKIESSKATFVKKKKKKKKQQQHSNLSLLFAPNTGFLVLFSSFFCCMNAPFGRKCWDKYSMLRI